MNSSKYSSSIAGERRDPIQVCLKAMAVSDIQPLVLSLPHSHVFSVFTDQSQVRTYLPFDVDEIIKWSFEGPFTEIIQSCNGLLLCKSLLFDGRNTSMGCPYLVHNPVTDKFLLLPFPPKSDFDRVPEDDFEQIAAVYLDFDPLRSFYFKVISIVKLPIGGADSGKFRIYVYSHSWDKGEVFFTPSSARKPSNLLPSTFILSFPFS